MYPNWIVNLFTNNPCTECRGAVTLDDISAIGVCRPEPFLAHLRAPYALIIATCRHCGQSIRFTTRCPKGALVEAVMELAVQIESAEAGKPPPFGPGSIQAPRSGHSSEATDAPLRPSIREDQAVGPPTDAEVKAFLARLRRMSFKAGSKGFERLTGRDRRDEHGDDAGGRNDSCQT